MADPNSQKHHPAGKGRPLPKGKDGRYQVPRVFSYNWLSCLVFLVPETVEPLLQAVSLLADAVEKGRPPAAAEATEEDNATRELVILIERLKSIPLS